KAAVGGATNNRRQLASNPLVDKEQKLIPSITRVFRKNQSLFVYLEVYDAAPNLFSAVTFFRGKTKAFESTPTMVTEALAKRPGVYPIQFELPLEKLVAGKYTCQLTLIDEAAKKFAFPRGSIVVLP
ncbi:MAG: VWA domain-containing protein, partial [Bryobacterales bacterium]|nr:VWA domain-containing protein [Bryobacterales bacterium]